MKKRQSISIHDENLIAYKSQEKAEMRERMIAEGKLRATKPGNPPPEESAKPKLPLPPAEPLHRFEKTLQCLADEMGFKVPSEVLQSRRESVAQFDRIFAYTQDLARMRTNEFASEAEELEAEALKTATAPTMETFAATRRANRDSYSARKGAAKLALSRNIRESAERDRPWLAKFNAAALKHVAKMEDAERKIAEKFHVRFEPSTTIVALHAAIASTAKAIPAPGTELYQNPKTFLPFLADE